MMKRIFLLIGLIMLNFSIVNAQEKNILSPNDTIPGQNIDIDVGPKTDFEFGGAIWLRSTFQDWIQENQANQRGFYFDQFRLSLKGDHGLDNNAKLKFSAQVRFWSYQFAVHHMWFGIALNDHHELRYGITNTPFGALPSISSSFWYSLNYYVGFEDDHDAGFHYIYKKDGFDFQFAYFRNEEYNNPELTNRFAPDLVVSGDQQNFERNQFNVRVAYTFGKDTSSTTEFGLSGEVGQIENQLTDDSGDRWALAAHYVGYYGKWNPYAQVVKYEFDPNNPNEIDDRTVLMGFFSDQRSIAARATTLTGGLRRHWDIDWWLIDKINAYVEYSTILKEASNFSDSKLFNPGFVVQAGPFYIWTDFLVGQNAWWFNDSQENSGLGAGAANSEKWEFRYNFSLQWYF